MKASEYGGSDTLKTQGIQPSPHQTTQTEELRLLYATDPSDPASVPDALAEKYTTPPGEEPLPSS